MATSNSPGDSLAGIGVFAVIAVGLYLYMGTNHGWDRHSFFVTVPYWSGPSEKEIRTNLNKSGWTIAGEIDRWPEVESAGDRDTRKGTKLYPVQIKTALDPNSQAVTIDLYFYRDDFGELKYYVHEPR